MHTTTKAPARALRIALAAVLTVASIGLVDGTREAKAQEIQLTGPLAGAPAVRRLRLHREGRHDLALHGTFSLLDEYRRSIMPGLRYNYFFTDWIGVGAFGGYTFSYNTGLSNELQEKAIDDRACASNPNSLACRRSATNLCRGEDCLANDQLGRQQWYAAIQATVVPFRGKLSLFGAATVDADISLFAGVAFAGVQERQECGPNSDANIQCGDADSYELASRLAVGPTFGLGFTFYPLDYMGFGTEFRLTPYAWNTSGFDKAGGGEDEAFPDESVTGADRSLAFNPALSVFVNFQLPPEIEISD
ncbi:MAG: hypothetical protein AAGN82_03740 [Myxococcota bacterium]